MVIGAIAYEDGKSRQSEALVEAAKVQKEPAARSRLGGHSFEWPLFCLTLASVLPAVDLLREHGAVD